MTLMQTRREFLTSTHPSHVRDAHSLPSKVADRILRYAAIAGRENVVAGTDCGLGGRVHADLM